ncbi:MAG: hypothetical protein PHQ01_01260, partial [Candidatus Pacebacteria bacterium]|nr:hypothetical protein [Candidatus Paceibacterota bacterium]
MKKKENRLYNKIFNSNIKKVLLISIAIFLAFLLVYLVTNALTKNSFSSSETNDSYYPNPEIIQVTESIVDGQELAASSSISVITSTTTSTSSIPEKASMVTSEGKYVKVV